MTEPNEAQSPAEDKAADAPSTPITGEKEEPRSEHLPPELEELKNAMERLPKGPLVAQVFFMNSPAVGANAAKVEKGKKRLFDLASKHYDLKRKLKAVELDLAIAGLSARRDGSILWSSVFAALPQLNPKDAFTYRIVEGAIQIHEQTEEERKEDEDEE